MWAEFSRTGSPGGVAGEEWREVGRSGDWEYWNINTHPSMVHREDLHTRFNRWR